MIQHVAHQEHSFKLHRELPYSLSSYLNIALWRIHHLLLQPPHHPVILRILIVVNLIVRLQLHTSHVRHPMMLMHQRPIYFCNFVQRIQCLSITFLAHHEVNVPTLSQLRLRITRSTNKTLHEDSLNPIRLKQLAHPANHLSMLLLLLLNLRRYAHPLQVQRLRWALPLLLQLLHTRKQIPTSDCFLAKAYSLPHSSAEGVRDRHT